MLNHTEYQVGVSGPLKWLWLLIVFIDKCFDCFSERFEAVEGSPGYLFVGTDAEEAFLPGRKPVNNLDPAPNLDHLAPAPLAAKWYKALSSNPEKSKDPSALIPQTLSAPIHHASGECAGAQPEGNGWKEPVGITFSGRIHTVHIRLIDKNPMPLK